MKQILAVVVRYEMALEASQTALSLTQAFLRFPDLHSSVQVLIWDNSREAIDPSSLPFPALYRHSSANVGLSGAYNSAAEHARAEDIPWLLLLDQDTRLPELFLKQMLAHAESLKDSPVVAAIVPTVHVGDVIVSPLQMLFNRHRPYPEQAPGLAEGETSAINSATLLRISNLLEIGGYSEAFWLDYSDWYVFHQFYLRGKGVWRATDIRVEHSMTVMDYDNLMSPWRYTNFIRAEGAFHDIYKGQLENAVQTLRLLARTLRQHRRFKNPVFSKITFRYFWWRIAHRKTKRIAEWRRAGQTPRPRADQVL